MRMATICSGIGAPEVASIGLGFTHAFAAEIEPFPSAVLAHHWPNVPNLGDMTAIDGRMWRGEVDLIVGGTPCQAFSVAGKRESLDDERGNLTLKFVELCDAINPPYILWENVPGVLSTKDNAFGCFLGALSGNDGELFAPGDGWSNAGCVIGPKRKLAWRILDAQYFGLAQRRRRVFVVACPRDGADPCEILFEREGVQRHSAPSREKGEGFAPGPNDGAAKCLTAHGVRMDPETENIIAFDTTQVTSSANYSNPQPGDPCHPLAAGAHPPAVAIGLDEEQNAVVDGFGCLKSRERGGGFEGSVMTPALQVRRLTPVECCRLQGFPDGYTRIPWRNKPAEDCPDGPRYKALGNSMAVPVISWILKRIRGAA